MSSREHVLAALDGVIDPELDEPITSLRFVSSVDITSDGDVEVLLRLPTPQCAPNCAFLMAADARAAGGAAAGGCERSPSSSRTTTPAMRSTGLSLGETASARVSR
jgi:metal-sulfur cluster biosynthetic enzyme